MTEQIRSEVMNLLGADTSGHSIDHVDRVHRMSLEFADQEDVDSTVISLIALLHDVDDYKLFGRESADNLTNAKRILSENHVDQKIASHALQSIAMMGYNNYLDGIRPDTLEGQIVSDADMCDAIGAQGLIRVFEYNASKSRPFFDKTILPVGADLTAEEYRTAGNGHAAQHFFDKLLNIPDILMTSAGKAEGQKRSEIMIDFLSEMFREEDAADWQKYLDDFLKNKRISGS